MTRIREGYQYIANLFNDSSYKPNHVLEDDLELSHLRTGFLERPRGSESLKATSGNSRSKYMEA